MKRTLILVAGIALCPAARAAEPAFKVEIDYSTAPECETFAVKSKAIVEEWYPKINEILFGKDHPLPRAVVNLKFEPMKGVAHATTDGIHISAEWVTKKSPDDYGMVVHELTHIVQNYKLGEGWLTEGIADYVRHAAYERDIKPTMSLDAHGRASGYSQKEPYFQGLESRGVDLTQKGYLQSYTVAASFLFWLEAHKDKEIVRHLNQALSAGRYAPALFAQFCGQSLDDLWAGYVADSEAARQ